jgi:GNAT superfamily N-acetyltransferase
MNEIATTYLEMTAQSQLRPAESSDPRFRVTEASFKQWEFNRFLYGLVGEPWAWRDKLSWSDERWRSYAESEAISTFVGYFDGSPAGYFELSLQEQEVELAYFGLAPRFIGRGLGGALLTRAIEEAWRFDPARVWVHTCTLDHPAALQNYLSRGMVVFKTEKNEVDQAPVPTVRLERGSA